MDLIKGDLTRERGPVDEKINRPKKGDYHVLINAKRSKRYGDYINKMFYIPRALVSHASLG